jgi:hypothetical protein
MAKQETSFYRSMRHLRKGGLHDALHIPRNEKIPASRLEAAKNSKNEHVRKMSILASNMKHWG